MHNALVQHSSFNMYKYADRKLTVTTTPIPLHSLVFFSFSASFSLGDCVCACAFSTCNFLLETLMPTNKAFAKSLAYSFLWVVCLKLIDSLYIPDLLAFALSSCLI